MKIKDNERFIKVPVYYAVIENKEVIDIDSMREHFEEELKQFDN